MPNCTRTRLAFVTVATFMLVACNEPSAPATTTPAAENPAPAASAAAARVAPSESRLLKVLAPDNIGRRLDIFERIAGAPKDATADGATYEVDGCVVNVTTKDSAITWITLSLAGPQCTVDLAPIVGQSHVVKPGAPLTYGDLEKAMSASAQYLAPCVGRGCGNAFEPYFEAVFPGVHANNFTDIVGSSMMSSDGVDAQTTAWVDELEQVAGEDYIFDSKVACDRAHDDLARKHLATAVVETLGFGHRDDPYAAQCAAN
jgi:hypothetical protein